ncbi:LPXTG cell wall anchor domain-containing protein, partial [Listeria monocytogenes]|nr:LPXTG cell wall anchor domain-containing protein [Listeria monocytogenes]
SDSSSTSASDSASASGSNSTSESLDYTSQTHSPTETNRILAKTGDGDGGFLQAMGMSLLGVLTATWGVLARRKKQGN